MKNLWADKRNRAQIKTVGSEFLVRLNFKVTCNVLQWFITNEKHLLKAVTSEQKKDFNNSSSSNNKVK